MKKRLISMLLTVLMVASLFGGMSVSAYADEEYATQEYTLKSGDTLLKVCNKLGLNWYSCQTAINKLNNISEAQFPDAIVPHGDNRGKNGHCVKAGYMCKYFVLLRDGETCHCNARGYEGKL